MTTYLPTLSEFRALRDRFQTERRNMAYPALIAQKQALDVEIRALRKQRDAASKHDKQIIENNLLPLTWQYQYVSGQLAVIDGDRFASERVTKEAVAA